MSSTAQSQTKDGAKAKTVFEAQAPAFSTQEAEAIALRAFDIQASAHPLASERDQNFQLRAKDGSEWVLKIANPAENPALLDMQTQALLHIAQVNPSLPIPRVKVTPDGAPFHEIDGAGLFIGVELVRDHSTLEPAAKGTAAVVNRMRDLGVLVGIEGPLSNVLKIRPPLVFDENHALQLTDTLDRALREI